MKKIQRDRWLVVSVVLTMAIFIILMLIPNTKQAGNVSNDISYSRSSENSAVGEETTEVVVSTELLTKMTTIMEQEVSALTENFTTGREVLTTIEMSTTTKQEFTVGEEATTTTKPEPTTTREETTTEKATTIMGILVTKEESTKETTEYLEETTSNSMKEDCIEEMDFLSEDLFDKFRHQTTNTLWNGDTTAKVMHPEQLEYLNEIADKWYRGVYGTGQLKEFALNKTPIKTNEDMFQLTGYYQSFIGDEALYKVVDVDACRIKLKGYCDSIEESSLWKMLSDKGEDSATANYLFVKACYSKNNDCTYVYYFDCKLQWVNNNFEF